MKLWLLFILLGIPWNLHMILIFETPILNGTHLIIIHHSSPLAFILCDPSLSIYIERERSTHTHHLSAFIITMNHHSSAQYTRALPGLLDLLHFVSRQAARVFAQRAAEMWRLDPVVWENWSRLGGPVVQKDFFWKSWMRMPSYSMISSGYVVRPLGFGIFFEREV